MYKQFNAPVKAAWVQSVHCRTSEVTNASGRRRKRFQGQIWLHVTFASILASSPRELPATLGKVCETQIVCVIEAASKHNGSPSFCSFAASVKLTNKFDLRTKY